MSKANLVKHAEFELKLAELDQEDSDYGGELYKSVMELIKLFSSQEHSGYSANTTIALFSKLARFENITPIGKTADEWVKIGSNVWQNKRAGHFFSNDGGETWTSVDDKEKTIYKKEV